MPLLYRRILLKLSGEALAGGRGWGIDEATLKGFATTVKNVVNGGTQVGLVIGGGNFFRGVSASSVIDRVSADHMGMLATVMNALAFKGALMSHGVQCRVMSAIPMATIAEPMVSQQAIRHLEDGAVVVFAGGTGNPFFTTDTNAALRALETGADVLIKATKVNGIYDKDPVKHGDARFFPELDFDTVLSLNLGVMDATAVSLCREHGLELRVINIFEQDGLARLLNGEAVGSVVRARRLVNG
ncbi:MAG TPA: UMP kinase [Deltaproteobacteria bacterium]|nr:UMP kinase [Deltaproteobacteria bacterium]HPR55247.1 UMP kinase [Deltaproteobacteria bacterium]HXK46884.1 UMP kinase [Deltaproteobacteria bacterium]